MIRKINVIREDQRIITCETKINTRWKSRYQQPFRAFSWRYTILNFNQYGIYRY